MNWVTLLVFYECEHENGMFSIVWDAAGVLKGS